jgi:uncharacterized protein YlxW (UPF0749 family)
MNSFRSQIFIGIVCLLLGLMLVTQLRAQSPSSAPVPTDNDAAHISRLYEENVRLREEVSQLSEEVAANQKDGSVEGSSRDASAFDLESVSIASGDTNVAGPGVTVLVEGELTVFELQDLVNEVRNASAEAVAVSGVRVVTRSAIVSDQDGRILLDGQTLSSPYRIEAIGDPDTLAPALQRKGGLIALLEADKPSLTIAVSRHSLEDKADWLQLPRSTADFTWIHAQPKP